MIPSGCIDRREFWRYARGELKVQPIGQMVHVGREVVEMRESSECHEDGRFTFHYRMGPNNPPMVFWLCDDIHALLGPVEYRLYWDHEYEVGQTQQTGSWVVDVLDRGTAVMLKLAYGI